MRRIAFLAILFTSLASTGCGAETPGARLEARPGALSRETDKQAMFGDAGLLPTREGERARRELALAGEISAALELLGLGPIRVDVELGRPKPSAVVVARVSSDEDLTTLDATISELSQAIVPGLDGSEVHVWLRPRASVDTPPPRPGSRPWTLVLACLGLGLSLGVTLERARARRR